MPKKTQALAIACLIVNLIIPGLGSLVWGIKTEGTIQLILAIAGLLFIPFLIGFPVLLAAWIWALVTSIGIVRSV